MPSTCIKGAWQSSHSSTIDEAFPYHGKSTKRREKYHGGNQVQSSKGQSGQMHPTQNLECFQGILPDQEQCGPEI